MLKQPTLAIIVPCYNEEAVINICYSEISSILHSLIQDGKISSESYICFVDDGSTDTTWELISNFAKNKDAKGLKFSRKTSWPFIRIAGFLPTPR